MAYNAEISRTNPACFVFLVDQSGSMKEPASGPEGTTKAEGVARAVNQLLYTLCIKCTSSNEIKDRFHLAVLGYGKQVGPALGGRLQGRLLVPISEVANFPLRVDQRVVEQDGVQKTIRSPVWFEPTANGKTPMHQALSMAHRIVQRFLQQHPDCYPPIIINITDGRPSDQHPLDISKSIRQLASTDGQVLLFNLHLCSGSDEHILFPSSADDLDDPYAKLLFHMSSPLPAKMLSEAAQRYQVQKGARGFAFNADLVSVIEFLDIGTKVH